MELLLELFMTAFVALVFSFLVAKLVSICTASDGVGCDSGLGSSKMVDDDAVMEKVKFDRGLKVKGTKSKKKVQFVVEDVVSKVDEFGGEGSVEKSEELRSGEEFVEKSRDVGKISDAAGPIDAEESCLGVSEVIGLSVRSSEVAADVVGGFESDEVNGGKMETGFEELVVEERGESTEADEFCGVKEENRANNAVDALVVEDKIGNEEADDEIGVKLVSDDIVVGQSRGVSGVEVGEDHGRIVGGGLNRGDEEERFADDEIGLKLVSDDIVDDRSEEVRGVEVGEDHGSVVEGGFNQGDEEEGFAGNEDEDEDWEGIERSELEKVFAAAANYLGCRGKDDGLSNLGSDVQMQLYGLHKVAMEGPCHEAQPMALMVSARAKWNAWQRLGNMSPEVAMEQYVSLLSDKDPGWMQGDSAGDGKSDSLEAAKPGVQDSSIKTDVPDPNISTDTQPHSNKERKLESGTDGGDLTGGSNFINTV